MTTPAPLPEKAATALAAIGSAHKEIAALGGASSLLHWDMQTHMPPKAAAARGEQLSALAAVIHEKSTAPHWAENLAILEALPAGSLGPQEAALVRETRYGYDRASKVPARLARELSEAESAGYDAWTEARRLGQFAKFAPALQRVLELRREEADCYGHNGCRWNALADSYERGMTVEAVQMFFAPLRETLPKLIDWILGRPGYAGSAPPRAWTSRWEPTAQLRFAERVAADLGYDFEGGRQDLSPHPFSTRIGHGDCRITTRVNDGNPMDAWGGTIHEVGHALYNQGLPEALVGLPTGDASSYAVHESQSRFWEVQVAHRLAFWEHYLPILRQYFPGRVGGLSPADVYRYVNHVSPSFIRVEADEITYNLHILVRFELEIALLDGSLAVADLPGAWNAAYKKYLGITPPNDSVGCMQDVHWSGGSFGYFPTYSMGNAYAAAIAKQMSLTLGSLDDLIRKGHFAPLLDWLRTEIHQHGNLLLPDELMRRAVGSAYDSGALVEHLESKYRSLYA